MTPEQRTQELVALQIGQLVLVGAQLRAENEALRAAAAAQAGGASGAPGGAEQRTGQEVS